MAVRLCHSCCQCSIPVFSHARPRAPPMRWKQAHGSQRHDWRLKAQATFHNHEQDQRQARDHSAGPRPAVLDLRPHDLNQAFTTPGWIQLLFDQLEPCSARSRGQWPAMRHLRASSISAVSCPRGYGPTIFWAPKMWQGLSSYDIIRHSILDAVTVASLRKTPRSTVLKPFLEALFWGATEMVSTFNNTINRNKLKWWWHGTKNTTENTRRVFKTVLEEVESEQTSFDRKSTKR
eukprot:3937699-Rhodomonas_salina.1